MCVCVCAIQANHVNVHMYVHASSNSHNLFLVEGTYVYSLVSRTSAIK